MLLDRRYAKPEPYRQLRIAQAVQTVEKKYVARPARQFIQSPVKPNNGLPTFKDAAGRRLLTFNFNFLNLVMIRCMAAC